MKTIENAVSSTGWVATLLLELVPGPHAARFVVKHVEHGNQSELRRPLRCRRDHVLTRRGDRHGPPEVVVGEFAVPIKEGVARGKARVEFV